MGGTFGGAIGGASVNAFFEYFQFTFFTIFDNTLLIQLCVPFLLAIFCLSSL